MKPRVYVETTVISYLTARPARDVVVAGHQQSTRDWWTTAADRYELVVSELVREEAGMGESGRGTSPALSGRLTCDPRRDSRSRDIGRSARPHRRGTPGRDSRRRAYRCRRSQWRRVPCNLEFPPYRQRGDKAAHRVCVSARRFPTSCNLHSRGIDGGHQR